MIDKERISEFITAGFNNYMNERKRTKGFHVSEVSKGCSRLLYLETVNDGIEFDISKIDNGIGMIVGVKMHEVPLSDYHETSVEYILDYNNQKYKVVGTFDELYIDEDGNKWVLDKKFSPTLKERCPDMYKRQVKLYALFLKKSGIDISGGIVSYIYVGENKRTQFKHFIVKMTEETYEETERWLQETLKKAIDGINTNTIPERNISWECTICPFRRECYTDDEQNYLLSKFYPNPIKLVGVDRLLNAQ